VPVQPIPCPPGGGTTPGECACAPSIAITPLCRADGTSVLVVIRSECAACGNPAADPAATGWVDPATGAYTAGPAPADAGPCDAGCVDTVCRQRCDDADGDGQADTTYSELWCIRADGSAELVLTYRDDPSVPYAPLAPVDCTYGSVEIETVMLCDDSGAFLRRYTFLGDTATFEDVALDGQTPHVVTGTVGVCPAEPDCASPTTPAATLGLCLADGTPIAVVVTRDCAGTVTQDGWLNLTTGTYTAGDPPAGAMACGNPRSISTTGTFCDVDPGTRDVLGLVLIEYTYGADGSVTAVRLVDATTGTTYTPAGTITTCPAGTEQPERDLIELCDVAADGTSTPFVRDFARDENGQITGHTDYLLDGTPYTPAGTVGRCTEPCRDTSSTLLCDTAATDSITVFDPANVAGSDGWEVVSFTGAFPGFGPEQAMPYPAPYGSPWGPAALGARADQNAGPSGVQWHGYDAAPQRWVLRKIFQAPEDGVAVAQSVGFRGDGGARVRINGVDAGMYGQWNQPATSGTAQIPVTAGPNTVEIEVRDVGGINNVYGRLDIALPRTVQFMRRQTVDCQTGQVIAAHDTTLDGEPYTVVGEVGQCEPVAECCEQPPPETRVDIESDVMCMVDATGTVLGQVLVERVYDDQSGDRVEQRYVDPVTGDPVTPPAGASFAVCPPEPCRDTYTTQVCDLPTGDPAGVPTATDTSAVPYPWDDAPIRCVNQHPGGGAALWAGGSVTIPARSSGAGGCSPNQWLAGLAATLQAPRPSCDSGTVTITVAVAARNDGPAAAAANYAGSVRIHRTDTGARLADSGSVLSGTAAGTARTMTATAVNVPAGLLAAGQIVVALDVEAWDQTGNTGAAWLLSGFTAAYEFQQDGCQTQFLRKIVTDCETGETISVTDTTLGGEPYTVVGEVGQCTPVVECCEQMPPEPRVDVESDVMCIRDADGEITGQVLVERVYDDQTGGRLEQRLTDPTSGDEVTLPDGAELVVCPQCPATFATECVKTVETVWSYDNTTARGSNCGSVQGPMYGSLLWIPCNVGPLEIRSWIIDGEDAVAAPVVFQPGPCGDDTGSGMHDHWATLLTQLDPSATWTTAYNERCAWYVQTVDAPPERVYGQMVVSLQGQPEYTWTAGPNNGSSETYYTKVYTQECDGTVSVKWLDVYGVETEAPTGTVVPCGGGGGPDSPDTEVVKLCDVAEDGTSVPFLRALTYIEGMDAPTVTDTLLDGTTPYTPTSTVSLCTPSSDEPGVDVELLPMCVIDDEGGGGVLQRVLAEITYDTATGERLAVNYVDPLTWGPVALPGGTHLDLCPEAQPEQECRDTSTLLLCDLPGDGAPAATVTDTSGAPYYPYTTGVPTAGAQTLWDGGTLTLPDAAGPQPGTGGTVRTAAAIVQAPRPACDAGTAHVTAQVDVTQLGPDTGCRTTGFLGLYNGPGEANRVAIALAPIDTPAGWSGTLTVEADVPAADLAAGNIAVLVAFDAYDDSGAACPLPRHTGWQLSAFAATTAYDQTGCAEQFLRNVITDCETGEVTAVRDTTLDGQPYTVTGQPGQCTQARSSTPALPCGDTELVKLCDLTYSPQAPIPTPAGDFSLSGNVVAGNDGTTLWFAQANQVADGVASLTVGGLLPAVRYEFRFASAWIGAGAPTPATNNAIYLLEILDGTTVLASRTRNVSNGSNVFPGGVLTEDLPLAFTPPASGTVTIRFTDQTTGGAVNDRDLFLMPLELRTEALTVTATPFLRRFTFDCDGGLTSTQDVGLDGTTPYTVAGEVGQCAADGDGASVTVPPCDANTVIQACRCDDADGDGLADTNYVELIGVDCEGVLTSLGTYLPDLSAPYVPVAPVDCDQTDQGADPAFGVQARRVELTAGASWSAAAFPTLQSVTAVAHGGTATITTADGPSTLHTGEAATWSVARDADAALTGPLTITADTGTVTLSYTIGVQL
jgi:hypothetical protein